MPVFITSADFTEEAINYLNEKKSTKKLVNYYVIEIFREKYMLIEKYQRDQRGVKD
ncbi:hypothetical protein DFH31_001987 [Clostridium beijerinckii]|nr:hypothetical protein [Clostridium beijerinckii]